MTKRKAKNMIRALKQQREVRISVLLKSGRITSSSEIPEDAIPAALELQNHSGTWSPPIFYRDYPFECKDCGKHEVWSASQQRWYYEIAKGSVLGRASRCRPCRKKHRAETERQRELLRIHRGRKTNKTTQPAKKSV